MTEHHAHLHPVKAARIYEEPTGATPTIRVLVDRLWPRGMTRERAGLDLWLRDVAPSTELRAWYGHVAARYEEFRLRYLAELDAPTRVEALRVLRECRERGSLVLLTATKEIQISHAAVLADKIVDLG